MKLPVLALSALLLLPAHPAAAQHHGTHTRIHINDDDHHHGSSPARPGPRHDLRDARFSMTTTDDVASLLLTRRVVALQLTEHALANIDDEMDDDDDGDGGFIGRMVASVVKSSVRTILRRSLEIPIDDVRSVDLRGGRLVITTEDGDRVFDQVEVNDTEVMERFSRRDAEEFVRQFRVLKARSR